MWLNVYSIKYNDHNGLDDRCSLPRFNPVKQLCLFRRYHLKLTTKDFEDGSISLMMKPYRMRIRCPLKILPDYFRLIDDVFPARLLAFKKNDISMIESLHFENIGMLAKRTRMQT